MGVFLELFGCAQFFYQVLQFHGFVRNMQEKSAGNLRIVKTQVFLICFPLKSIVLTDINQLTISHKPNHADRSARCKIIKTLTFARIFTDKFFKILVETFLVMFSKRLFKLYFEN